MPRHCPISAETAISSLNDKVFDLVLTDLRMPGVGGMSLLTHLARDWPPLPVIVISRRSNGLVTKSAAPFRMASTATGTLACAVMILAKVGRVLGLRSSD
ncbi:MAG: response regulator [Deltaproteobacteria bacterium]|nr:response regulator [Deltaproteobacteria bacterium]